MPALGHAVAGSTGAAISNVCTYPLDLIITRLQIQRQLRKASGEPHSDEYKSIRDAVQKIYRHEGLAGLYTGVLQDTSKTVADSFLFFLAYNFLRQARLRSKDSPNYLPVLDELSVGFLAGSFSKFWTTPISNIVTRLQASSMVTARSNDGKPAANVSMRAIAHQIRQEKGIKGFWSGYSASLVLTLNPSLTFFFFETFKRLVLPKPQRSDPSPTATFFLAAISKALASSITYPFSLAKARAQASSKTVNDQSSGIPQEKTDSQEALSPTSATSRKAVYRTVFGTILEIARSEGISALYEGLGGEVMKGFFSHGITMLMKEAVHKVIIKLYYALSKQLKRYPGPQQLADMAKEQAQHVAESTRSGVETAQSTGRNLAQQASTLTTDSINSSKAAAESTGTAVKSGMNSMGEQAAETMEQLYKEGKQVANNVLTNANETADLIADYVGKEVDDMGWSNSLKDEGGGKKD